MSGTNPEGNQDGLGGKRGDDEGGLSGNREGGYRGLSELLGLGEDGRTDTSIIVAVLLG